MRESAFMVDIVNSTVANRFDFGYDTPCRA
jgi:hypothetical protein